jgi:hypothetical protein
MKTICLDFDGVIHLNLAYVSPTVINGNPVDGVGAAIQELRTQYRVVVYSCRCAADGGADAIKSWLDAQGFEVDDVVDRKPMAEVYIDDRGIPFAGDWTETMNAIETFSPWYAGLKRMYSECRKRAEEGRSRLMKVK